MTQLQPLNVLCQTLAVMMTVLLSTMRAKAAGQVTTVLERRFQA
jgi:hypothetical protein